ncbi:MAG: HAD family phosphatase [Calditrichaeota bacterium]|nr:MAG: HAD family phosphatase [Calditrichota bacterium]
MIKAVLFDFDGVLVDSYKYHLQAWKFVLEPLGIRVQPQEVFLNEGQPVMGIARNLLKRTGRHFSDAEIRELVERKNRHFQAHNRARFIEGIPEFLRDLKQKNIKIALVTGTLRKNIASVLSPQQMRLFDVIVAEEDSPRGKPYPDPYLIAAQKLGVPPDECVVVENAPLGIQAAKSAGMRCIALTTTLPSQYLQEADAIFPNVAELRQHFPQFYLKG